MVAAMSVVLAAVHTDKLLRGSNMTSSQNARAGASTHGDVNVLLSGAMLSGLILIVFLICYCCHKNMSKQASRNAQYWHEENDVPLEIFTVDGQCYEVAGVFVPSPSCGSLDTVSCPALTTPSPPPAYDAVVREDAKKPAAAPPAPAAATASHPASAPAQEEEDAGLPSYEAALRIESQGYV